MRLKLKNIGIIKETSIKLKGLTVITGHNNSGKSTVGKALFASIEAFSNLDQKRELEINSALMEIVFEIQRILSLQEVVRYLDFTKIEEEYQKVFEVLTSGIRFPFSRKNFDIPVENYYLSIKEFLEILSGQYLLSKTNKTKNELPKKFFHYLENLETSKNKALKVLDKLAELINDKDNLKYSKLIVNTILNKEFHKQIYPIRGKEKEKISKISLIRNEEVGFDFTMLKEKGVINTGKIFNKLFYNNVILIDDAYVIDDSNEYYLRRYRYPFPYTFMGETYGYTHKEKLLGLLSKDSDSSAIEQFLKNKNYEEIRKEINSVVPGEIIEKDGNYFYLENNNAEPLRFENLATGSKTFAILKTLLKNGKIDLDTMLILDEPEAHLHPQWQNIMAELIVLLVNRLDVNILLTTHSINFLLAIETFVKKYNICDKTTYYQTEYVDAEKYMVTHKEIENLNEMYEKFSKPFIYMSNMNNKINQMLIPEED